MRTLLKEVQGIDWFDGAVMNCVWKGPRLRDVILAAGLSSEVGVYDNDRKGLGTSIPSMVSFIEAMP